MWPLRNRRTKPSQTKVPEEVKKYYKAAQRDRMGIAWLIAFLTLVVTVAVVLLLFLGGRWIYRKTVNNTPKPPQTVKPTNTKNENEPPAPPTSGTSSTPGSSGSSAQDGSNQPSQNPQPTPTPPAQNTNLLRTGPEGDD